MKIPRPETQKVIENLLRDLDFPEYYRKYEWQSDTHSNGFPYFCSLEKEISEAAKNNAIMRDHLLKIAKWGKLPSKKISCLSAA